jgi:hypothetical protein
MNRGFLGVVRGKGKQMGPQRIYLGYNQIGSSSQAIAAGSLKKLYKPVTPPRDGLLCAIEVFMQGNAGSNINCLKGCVHEDNLGVPGKLIGVIGAETAGSVLCNDFTMSATPRWVSTPMTMILRGGVHYWLCANIGYGTTHYYNDDTNRDLEQSINETWQRDGSLATFTVSNKNWCIRAPFIY